MPAHITTAVCTVMKCALEICVMNRSAAFVDLKHRGEDGAVTPSWDAV